jgi:hypothetical protein
LYYEHIAEFDRDGEGMDGKAAELDRVSLEARIDFPLDVAPERLIDKIGGNDEEQNENEKGAATNCKNA